MSFQFRFNILCVCSICMYHDRVGEFWYQLRMSADPPTPTVLPQMECELGRWTRQNIVLDVPTEHVITVEPFVSNPNNFLLDYNVSTPLEIKADCPLILPLTFVPTMLCTGEQTATIVFRSQQVCEMAWCLGSVVVRASDL